MGSRASLLSSLGYYASEFEEGMVEARGGTFQSEKNDTDGQHYPVDPVADNGYVLNDNRIMREGEKSFKAEGWNCRNMVQPTWYVIK